MFVEHMVITKESFVSEIARNDYRTAAVFRKHDIDFCCGGKWPLGTLCELKGLDFLVIKNELERSIRTVQLSNGIQFDRWSIDFLTDYIINIHHQYLRDELPWIKEQLDRFTTSHVDRFPYMNEVQQQFGYLCEELVPHIAQEEEVLFPYIRQIDHAYHSNEAYASLLVRTLRKPVKDVMEHENDFILKTLHVIRKLTGNYQSPNGACVSHEVTFSLLRELDTDLCQHLYLESEILFPKAISMEQELLRG